MDPLISLPDLVGQGACSNKKLNLIQPSGVWGGFPPERERGRRRRWVTGQGRGAERNAHQHKDAREGARNQAQGTLFLLLVHIADEISRIPFAISASSVFCIVFIDARALSAPDSFVICLIVFSATVSFL
jgi:hypothetical protein